MTALAKRPKKVELPPGVVMLPDKGQWINRFKIPGESGNLYTVAQNIKGHWGCSCRGWIAHRNCKHLKKMGIPCGKHLPKYYPKRLDYVQD
jgi:hypothetical protein